MSQQIYRHEAQTSTQDGGALNKQMNKQTKQHYECFITYRKFQLYNFERGFRRVYKLEGGEGLITGLKKVFQNKLYKSAMELSLKTS